MPLGTRARRAASCYDGLVTRLRALVLVCPLLLLPLGSGCGSPPAAVPFGSRPPTVAAAPDIAPLERAMLERLNRDRAVEGLAPLGWDARLADVARAHSEDMRVHGFFAHESPTTGEVDARLEAAGYLALEARENLALAPDVERASDNLLRSPGHRANLLSTTVSHVGIGIVRGDSAGDPTMLTITQVFARPVAAATAAEVATAVGSILADFRKREGLGPLARDPALDELARKHLAEVPLDLASSALVAIGNAVAAELSARPGHGLKAVDVAAQIVLEASQFEPPSGARHPQTRKLGLAVEPVIDEQGRQQFRVLALLGR